MFTMKAGAVLLSVLLTLVSRTHGQVTTTAQPTQRKVTIPPLIIEEPPHKMAFRVHESIEMPCVATGEPQPQYYWKMNDKDFDPSGNDGRIAIQPGVGTLIFARPLERDEAIYQCFAQNQVGIALTVKVDLRMAILEAFPASSTKYHYPILGHYATLSCIPPRSYPPADIFWATIAEGEGLIPIDLDDRITMDPEGNLHFVNVITADYQNGRKYACIVQNKVMRSIQQGAYAVVNPQGQNPEKMAPSILWQSPNNQVTLRGQIWRIKCVFSGSPTPRVNWGRLGAEMSPRSRQESFGQELVIEDVQFEDEGKYECQGINEQAQTPIRRSFTLQVEAAPYWIIRPQSVDAAEFETSYIECQAAGIPETVNFWFIDGIPLSNLPADSRRQAEKNRITFTNVTRDDAHVVQCNATNKHGYIYQNAYLNVLSEPPMILNPPLEAQKAAEGQTIYLQCEVFGSPKPLVYWRKGSEQLTGGRYKVMPEGHLQITDVMLVDAGTYTCTATNRFDTVSATGGLVVRRATRIQTKPLDVMVYEGTEAKFTCTATTDAEEVLNQQIDWKKDGQIINYALAQRVFKNDLDNSLTISGTISLDTGKYTCVASNGLDEDESSAQLVVQGPPDPPKNVEVDCRNPKGFTEIIWQPGKENYAPILNFIIQFNTSFTPDTWIDIANNVSQNERSRMLTLSPYGNYTFRVLARNKIGVSPPSEHTTTICTEEPSVPHKNPENVMGEGDEPDNLVVFWTPMPKIEQNGNGFYYIIGWQRADIQDAVTDTARVDEHWAWHYVVEDKMESYVPFNVWVKAGNSMGEAIITPKSVRGYSGEDVPEVWPTDVSVDRDTIGSTEAILIWSQVSTAPEDIHGYFRGYRVQFGNASEWPENIREQDFFFNDPVQYPRPRPRGVIRYKREVPPVNSEVTVKLTHLPAFTKVYVQVRVLNKYYVGPPSERVEFDTKEGAPGPPALFDVVARGSTHFDLRWARPYEQNGNLIGYNISYQIISGLNLGRLQYRDPIRDPDQKETKLTGLMPDTYYRIYLFASTGSARGEPIFLDEKTTKAGPPSPPTFAIVGMNDTWVNITWEPSRSGSPGSVFYVQYRPRGWYEWWHTPDQAMTNYIYLFELDPGTAYQARVVAKNGEGWETGSEWQEFKTDGITPGRMELATSAWFYGIWISLLLIIIAIVVFIFLKKITDRWFDSKEEEIQEQLRQLQAEEAAKQMGILNQYADTGSREVIDPSQGEMSYASDYKQPMATYSDEEEYSDEEYDQQDAAAAAPPQVGYAPPMVGYHPALQQPGYAPDAGQVPPDAMQAEGGQYVLATKPTSTDSFV